MDLVIQVTVLGGTDIERAISQAIDLRNKTGANVEFSFNGERVFICRDNQTIKDLVEKYHKALDSHQLIA